jgi:hypothetical protein
LGGPLAKALKRTISSESLVLKGSELLWKRSSSHENESKEPKEHSGEKSEFRY